MWAIDFIDRHSEYQPSFNNAIISLLKTDSPKLSKKALDYFTPVRLLDPHIQKEFAKMAGEASLHNKYEIISKFSTLQQVNDDAILILLELFENQKINAGLLGNVCKLIQPENMKNALIVEKLTSISRDKNMFVRNMTQKLISDIKNK